MADDYAAYALSQRASFEQTFPVVMDAAREFDDEEVLRVMDLGAADGVNSHALMADLIALRGGRSLVYSFVDMPTNAWAVASGHLEKDGRLGASVAVVPAPQAVGARDLGTGAHFPSADAHAAALDEAGEAAAVVVGMAGIPLHTAPCMPPATVYIAVSGTTMHWVEAPADLGSSGSVFPGYPDHTDQAERSAWRSAAARQWEHLLEMRGIELAPGGYLIVALPASPDPCPGRTGPYAEASHEMNGILAEWCAAGRIAESTAAAVVVPVWMRTLEEIRAPFDRAGGVFAGLRLETAELFRLDNPYWDDDPVVFAEEYVKSVAAWGAPLLTRAFAREGDDAAGALREAFLHELAARVATNADRYRWDYIEALVVARRA